MAALQAQNGLACVALELLILTAARTSEVIGASWAEFDLDRALWTIPAERMKAAKAHVIPLPGRAGEILRQLEKAKLGEYVFPGPKAGEPLSTAAMAAVIKRMHAKRLQDDGRGWIEAEAAGRPVVPHGFRSSFRDWAGETTSFPREVIEAAMAHRLKDKAEAAYARGTMPERRRKLMEAWAAYCANARHNVANVIPMKPAR